MNVDVLGSRVEIDASLVDEPTAEIRTQVSEYLDGDRRTFDLTVEFPGGPTGDVLVAIDAIPYGRTRSYGDLAADLGTAPVAVGQACARNPVPVVVPCHRVVGSDGELRGYTGADGVTTKRGLLDHESRVRGGEPVQTKLSEDR